MDDPEVERLIRGARPVPPTQHSATLASLDQLTAEVTRKSSRHRRRDVVRRGSRKAVLATVLVCALGATTAAAAVVAARTGWFTEPSSEADGTEWLDTGGTDYPSVVVELAPDYLSYPQGLTEADATEWIVDGTQITGGLVQETGIRRSYETYALCTWTGAWLDPAGDETERDEAVEQLTSAADWPALNATDGGGIMDAVRALGAAVEDDDTAGVLTQVEILCPPDLVGEE